VLANKALPLLVKNINIQVNAHISYTPFYRVLQQTKGLMPLSLDLPKGMRDFSSSKVVSVEAGGADAADIARHWLHACSTLNTNNLSKGRCDSSDGASSSGCLGIPAPLTPPIVKQVM